MDVTAQLLRVYLVDKQIRGLRSRLTGAEKFLTEQDTQVSQLDAKRQTLDAQLKQFKVRAAEHEGEMARLDARLATLKSQMDSAQTNKEYKAFLTEMNTLKAERDRLETAALEQMSKIDEVKKQAEELTGQRGERERIRITAADEREKRHVEIRDRLAELEAERKQAAAGVAPEVMSMFNRLLAQRGEEAMAPVEIHDFKRHEFTCGACMMSLPLDLVSGLLSAGKLTKCVSCQCILYLDEAAREAAAPPPGKKSRSAVVD